jgi:hypothetical protein
MEMRRNAFWGVVLIVVGVLFLADSMGFIDIDIWGAIWALAIMGAGLWLLLRFTFTRDLKDTGSVNVPLEGAAKAKITLRHGAGRLSLTGGAEVEDVLSGTFHGRLTHSAKMVGDVLEVKAREETWMFPFAEPRHWSLRCTDQVPIYLEVHSGASEAIVDLTVLKVSDFLLSAGVGESRVTLPAGAGFTKAEISSGVGAIHVRIPDGVAASIRSSGGISSTRVDRNRFPRSGGRFQSPDYEEAENKVELKVSTGIGSVDVR